MRQLLAILALAVAGVALASCGYPTDQASYAYPEYSGWPYERLDPDVYVTRGDHDRDVDRDRDHDRDGDHDRGFGHFRH
jgi:hypothetical protein